MKYKRKTFHGVKIGEGERRTRGADEGRQTTESESRRDLDQTTL